MHAQKSEGVGECVGWVYMVGLGLEWVVVVDGCEGDKNKLFVCCRSTLPSPTIQVDVTD